MLNFRRIQIDDKNWISEILKNSSNMGCDNAFGTMFVWSDAYNLEICCENGFLFRRYGEKLNAYSFPIGNGNVKNALDLLFCEFYSQEGFHLIGLTEYMTHQINRLFPDKFFFVEKRDQADYIYKTENLAFLSGKKYHGKRNHISKFEKKYQWKYEKVTKQNIEDCLEIFKQWSKSDRRLTYDTSKEKNAIDKAFQNFEVLEFVGGLIKVEEKPVAFDIGEKINKDIFVIHFEKASTEFDGAYAIINKEFAKNEILDYKYVNREEDLGIEGLRKSKLSYHPEIILSRFDAFPKK